MAVVPPTWHAPLGQFRKQRRDDSHWQLLGAVGALRLSWSRLALLVQCDVLHQPGAGVLPGRSADGARPEITHSASGSVGTGDASSLP